MAVRSKQKPVLQTVDHALQILEVFDLDTPELGVTELGRRLGIPAPPAYRLLASLESRGFLEQDPGSKRYRLGLKIFEIASRVTSSRDLVGTAHPQLEELVRMAGETAYLAVWDHGSSMIVDKVDSPLPVSVRKTIGMRLPAYATSTGRCLLAFQSPTVIDSVLAPSGRAHAARPLGDPKAVRAELAEIRRQGHAVNLGEFRAEAASIASPVRDRFGKVVAAVGLGVPMQRMSEQRLPELIRLVSEAARATSIRLGWGAAGAAVISDSSIRGDEARAANRQP